MASLVQEPAQVEQHKKLTCSDASKLVGPHQNNNHAHVYMPVYTGIMHHMIMYDIVHNISHKSRPNVETFCSTFCSLDPGPNSEVSY